MVGLTHVSFRRVMQDYLPSHCRALWFTEMLSVQKIIHQNLEKSSLISRSLKDQPLIVQVLGSDLKAMQKAAQKLKDWGADGIDLNMGCPENAAKRIQSGADLITAPEKALSFVKAIKESTGLMVSAKIRASQKGNVQYLIDLVGSLEQAGLDWITLHPRTKEQKRRGVADWSQVRDLKNALSLPVIGNGDVQTVDDVIDRLDEFSCDAVMVGRALVARPWLFGQVAERIGLIEGQSSPQTPAEEGMEYKLTLLKLIDYLVEDFEQEHVLKRICFHVRTSSPWLPYGAFFLGEVTKSTSIENLKQRIEIFFHKNDNSTLKSKTQWRS